MNWQEKYSTLTGTVPCPHYCTCGRNHLQQDLRNTVLGRGGSTRTRSSWNSLWALFRAIVLGGGTEVGLEEGLGRGTGAPSVITRPVGPSEGRGSWTPGGAPWMRPSSSPQGRRRLLLLLGPEDPWIPLGGAGAQAQGCPLSMGQQEDWLPAASGQRDVHDA